jgi:hypothetical protein
VRPVGSSILDYFRVAPSERTVFLCVYLEAIASAEGGARVVIE